MNALVDWLGAGGTPVPMPVASNRAAICGACPKNSHGEWWESAKQPVAAVIKGMMELKAAREITVPNEKYLFMCEACGCAIRLKVHAPIEHIRENLTFSQAEKLDKNCWILEEIKR